MSRKKDKIQKTVERMKKIRKKDSVYLRGLIEEKLKWILSEQLKLAEIINRIEKQLDNYNELMLKLKGAELALNDILGKETEEVWQTDLQKSKQNSSKIMI